jgi:hypothetical protein
MGTRNQCELVLAVPLLDAMANDLAHPLVTTLGLHCVAQAEYLSDDDCTLHSQCFGLATDLGIDSRVGVNLTGAGKNPG